MFVISQFYRGLELPHLPASFEHQWPSEKPSSARDGVTDSLAVSSNELNGLLSAGDTERHSLLQMIFYPEEVKAILRSIHDKTGGRAPQVSSQDVVVAFTIELYNRMVDSPIVNARFVLTVSHLTQYAYDYNLMIPPYRQKHPIFANRWHNPDFNDEMYLLDVPIVHSRGIEDKAIAFRKAIIQSRTPRNLNGLFARRSVIGFDMLRNGQNTSWSAQGTMVVNGLQRCAPLQFNQKVVSHEHLSCDFVGDAHFGYPGRAQAYYSSCYARYLTLSKANPVMLSDGSWTRNTYHIGMAVPVPHAAHDDMLLAKQELMSTLLNKAKA
jgi:hypothetical protein